MDDPSRPHLDAHRRGSILHDPHALRPNPPVRADDPPDLRFSDQRRRGDLLVSGLRHRHRLARGHREHSGRCHRHQTGGSRRRLLDVAGRVPGNGQRLRRGRARPAVQDPLARRHVPRRPGLLHPARPGVARMGRGLRRLPHLLLRHLLRDGSGQHDRRHPRRAVRHRPLGDGARPPGPLRAHPLRGAQARGQDLRMGGAADGHRLHRTGGRRGGDEPRPRLPDVQGDPRQRLRRP